MLKVLSELESQRESLLRTRQRLEDADEELSQARRILKKMYVNILTNKILLGVIIILELAILGGSIYHRLS
jgi:vesicle transport through interaction with t-SNAREs 1